MKLRNFTVIQKGARRMIGQPKKRIDVHVPTPLLEVIENYQRSENISTRTAALLELVRLGLKYYEQEQTKNDYA